MAMAWKSTVAIILNTITRTIRTTPALRVI